MPSRNTDAPLELLAHVSQNGSALQFCPGQNSYPKKTPIAPGPCQSVALLPPSLCRDGGVVLHTGTDPLSHRKQDLQQKKSSFILIQQNYTQNGGRTLQDTGKCTISHIPGTYPIPFLFSCLLLSHPWSWKSHAEGKQKNSSSCTAGKEQAWKEFAKSPRSTIYSQQVFLKVNFKGITEPGRNRPLIRITQGCVTTGAAI